MGSTQESTVYNVRHVRRPKLENQALEQTGRLETEGLKAYREMHGEKRAPPSKKLLHGVALDSPEDT
jgi:hypothetical protein